MITQDQEYLDKLFVQDVARIHELTNTWTEYDKLSIAGILRRLVVDKKSLAFTVSKHYKTPLLVLVREPESGNTPRDQLISVPKNVMRYARDVNGPNCLPGMYLKPYRLQEYLTYPLAVLPVQGKGETVNPREIIRLLANKLGGVHADTVIQDGRKDRSGFVFQMNRNVSIFGEGAIFNQFGLVVEDILRCLMPLRDEVVAAYDSDESGAESD